MKEACKSVGRLTLKHLLLWGMKLVVLATFSSCHRLWFCPARAWLGARWEQAKTRAHLDWRPVLSRVRSSGRSRTSSHGEHEIRVLPSSRLGLTGGLLYSFSRSVDTVINIKNNLRIVLVKCHGDDISFIFHDISLSSLILLVYVSKFNVYDTLITLPLRLA